MQTASAEILGLAVFDAEAFATHVEHVDVLKSHLLRFVLYTGEEIEYQWKDRSRSESWTDEMRETARQDALRRSL